MTKPGACVPVLIVCCKRGLHIRFAFLPIFLHRNLVVQQPWLQRSARASVVPGSVVLAAGGVAMLFVDSAAADAAGCGCCRGPAAALSLCPN